MYQNVKPLLPTYIEMNPFLRSVKRVVSRIPPPPIHSGSSSGKRREDQTSPARTEGGEIFTVEVAAEGGVGGENHERTAGGGVIFWTLMASASSEGVCFLRLVSFGQAGGAGAFFFLPSLLPIDSPAKNRNYVRSSGVLPLARASCSQIFFSFPPDI